MLGSSTKTAMRKRWEKNDLGVLNAGAAVEEEEEEDACDAYWDVSFGMDRVNSKSH
jgi:hypothetical protein